MAQGSAPPHPRRRALPLAAHDAVELDCTRCGACCFSSDPRYIALYAVDEARLDARALPLTTVVDGRRFMRFQPPSGACAALVEDGNRLLCSIYDQRPDACRWLVPGSGPCLAAREA